MKWNVWHIPSERWLGTKSWGRKYHAQMTFRHLVEHEGCDAGEMEVCQVLPVPGEEVLVTGFVPNWGASGDSFRR